MTCCFPMGHLQGVGPSILATMLNAATYRIDCGGRLQHTNGTWRRESVPIATRYATKLLLPTVLCGIIHAVPRDCAAESRGESRAEKEAGRMRFGICVRNTPPVCGVDRQTARHASWHAVSCEPAAAGPGPGWLSTPERRSTRQGRTD